MIQTRLDADRSLAIHQSEADSTISLVDVQETMRVLAQNRRFEPHYAIIWDLSKSNLGITLQEIIYLDQGIVQRANHARPAGKTAWVTATAFGESIIQLLYSQHEWSAEWRTFSTLNAAIAWCTHSR